MASIAQGLTVLDLTQGMAGARTRGQGDAGAVAVVGVDVPGAGAGCRRAACRAST